MPGGWQPRESWRRSLAVIVAAGTVAAVAACGTSRTRTAPAPSNPPGELSAVLSHTVAVTVTAAGGCRADRGTYAAGQLLVSITNEDAVGVSGVQLLNGAQIVGERDDVPAGFTGSFAVTTPPGSYTLFCPGAAGGRVAIRIVGASMPAGGSNLQQLLDRAGTDYGHYVVTRAGDLVTQAIALRAALAHGHQGAARSAYAKARSAYAQIATVSEPFDDEINAREGEVPPAEWDGFHRIEKGLFQQKITTGLATQASWLVDHARKLQSLVSKLPLEPGDLTHAAMDLLTGVFRSALLGEEERYSHYDLLDVSSNVVGAAQAFTSLRPALQRVDPKLTATLDSAFSNLRTQLNRYRCSWMPSGFEPYGSLTDAQLTGLAHAVQAVVEPLSMAASKVVSG
ncbi:MAG TPA: EfeM/EfeO family lipoprotein [Jatrophihabitantaceae bacterium]|nr:EfeM/EfeO family lipoprotein [Jatrophihabitantaceae bacterium]